MLYPIFDQKGLQPSHCSSWQSSDIVTEIQRLSPPFGIKLFLVYLDIWCGLSVSQAWTQKNMFSSQSNFLLFSFSDLWSLHYSGFHSKLDQVSKEIPPPIQNNSKDLFLHQFPTPKNTKKTNNDSKESSVPRCLVAPRRASSLAQAPLNGRHSLRSVAAAATKQRAQQRAPKAPTSQGKSNKAKLAVDDCDSLRLVLFGFQWTSEIGNVIFDGISLRNPGEIPTFYGNPHGNPRQCKRSSTLRTSTPGRRFWPTLGLSMGVPPLDGWFQGKSIYKWWFIVDLPSYKMVDLSS